MRKRVVTRAMAATACRRASHQACIAPRRSEVDYQALGSWLPVATDRARMLDAAAGIVRALSEDVCNDDDGAVA
jgi:hypothetical protein